MQFTTLSALVAFAFVLGTEAAAFASSSEAFASTVTFAAPSTVATASDHHGHGASSSFIGFPTTIAASSAFATTAAPSSVPTFVPGDGSGAFICFPVASGFAVPGLNGTVIFPNSAAPTATAFPSSAPTTVVASATPTGTVVTTSVFATGTAVASSVFTTDTAAASSAFATTSAF